MKFLLITPLFLQGVIFCCDEFIFHCKRGLPKWERIGHPIDSFLYFITLLWIVLFPLTPANQVIFLILAFISSFIIIKDEKVHLQHSLPNEQYLHALLFILHPLCLISAYFIWPLLHGAESLIKFTSKDYTMLTFYIYFQTTLSISFCLYQIIYWNFIRKDDVREEINNDYYDTLGNDWYNADDDPIALLKAEQKLKNRWIEQEMLKLLGKEDLTGIKVLDIGCGGGFLTNYLSLKGALVTGIDQSLDSLKIAKEYDKTGKVKYLPADAYKLPFHPESFDFIFAMDFLEHVEKPNKVIEEAVRVLKRKGSFFYHTFNRNFFSWLLVIKFVEWFMPKSPKNIHILRLFIKPGELLLMLKKNGLCNNSLQGIGPKFLTYSFFWSLRNKRVHPEFSFEFKNSKLLAYVGHASRIKMLL